MGTFTVQCKSTHTTPKAPTSQFCLIISHLAQPHRAIIMDAKNLCHDQIFCKIFLDLLQRSTSDGRFNSAFISCSVGHLCKLFSHKRSKNSITNAWELLIERKARAEKMTRPLLCDRAPRHKKRGSIILLSLLHLRSRCSKSAITTTVKYIESRAVSCCFCCFQRNRGAEQSRLASEYIRISYTSLVLLFV